MKSAAFWVLAIFGLFLFFSPQVLAIPVDLSTFDLIDDTVTILGPDNSSAEITEYWSPDTLLDNDLSIPINAFSLTFDYKLVVGQDNHDFFGFYFDDPTQPMDQIGGYEGTYTGTINKDLTPYAGSQIFLAFTLNYVWDDAGYDSVLTISNVHMNPVPEPTTLLLLGSGLLGIIGIRKRKISGATR